MNVSGDYDVDVELVKENDDIVSEMVMKSLIFEDHVDDDTSKNCVFDLLPIVVGRSFRKTDVWTQVSSDELVGLDIELSSGLVELVSQSWNLWSSKIGGSVSQDCPYLSQTVSCVDEGSNSFLRIESHSTGLRHSSIGQTANHLEVPKFANYLCEVWHQHHQLDSQKA